MKARLSDAGADLMQMFQTVEARRQLKDEHAINAEMKQGDGGADHMADSVIL